MLTMLARAAPAVPAHRADGVLAAEEHAVEVGGEHRAPGVERGVLGSCGAGPSSKPVMPALLTSTSSRPERGERLAGHAAPVLGLGARRAAVVRAAAERRRPARRPGRRATSVSSTVGALGANARATAAPMPAPRR
jgi:hypothetical protein